MVLLQCIGRTRIGCWALLLQRATIKISNNKHVYLYSLSLWLDMGSSRKRGKVLLLPLCNARSKFPECYFFPSFGICIFRLFKKRFFVSYHHICNIIFSCISSVSLYQELNMNTGLINLLIFFQKTIKSEINHFC